MADTRVLVQNSLILTRKLVDKNINFGQQFYPGVGDHLLKFGRGISSNLVSLMKYHAKSISSFYFNCLHKSLLDENQKASIIWNHFNFLLH